jgi:transmembrane 9 superfamily member 2/4
MNSARLLVSLLALSLLTNAFYLPGAAPHNYADGDKIELYVNALTPMLAGNDDAKLVFSLQFSLFRVGTEVLLYRNL